MEIIYRARPDVVGTMFIEKIKEHYINGLEYYSINESAFKDYLHLLEVMFDEYYALITHQKLTGIRHDSPFSKQEFIDMHVSKLIEAKVGSPTLSQEQAKYDWIMYNGGTVVDVYPNKTKQQAKDFLLERTDANPKSNCSLKAINFTGLVLTVDKSIKVIEKQG